MSAPAPTTSEIESRLATVLESQEKLSKENVKLVDQWRSAVQKGEAHEAGIKKLSAELEKIGPQLVEMEQQRNALQASLDETKRDLVSAKGVIKDLELGLQNRSSAPPSKHPLHALTESERFKAWHQRAMSGEGGSATFEQAGSWFRTRDALPSMGTAELGGGAEPQYRPGIRQPPEYALSILRTLIPTLGTTAPTVVTKRASKLKRYLKLASTVNTSPGTAFVVEDKDKTGILPQAEVTFTEGENAQTVTVQSVSGATVTVSPALTYAYTTAAHVTMDFWTTTPGLTHKPRTALRLDPYNVPIATLAALMRVGNEHLADIPTLRAYLMRVGMQTLAKMESRNFLRGPGDGQTGIRGLMNDPEIEDLPAWSALGADKNILDYLIFGYYELAQVHVRSTAALLSVPFHQRLANLKGDGRYIFWMDQSPGVPPRIMAMRVEWDSMLTAAQGIMGDFALAATIYDRQLASIAFGLGTSDWEENAQTARAEERVGLGVEQPEYLARLNADAPPVEEVS